MRDRWTRERARAWWDGQAWPIGFNYVTSSAVNDVQMWMKDTFDPMLIDRELRLASEWGYNSLRVFLSYTVWREEGKAFLDSFETFLTVAAKNGLTVMPVLFDDCAFDFGAQPFYGPQPEPVPGVHNSRWVPSPGFAAQDDPALLPSLRAYLQAVIGAHRGDARVLAWDLYNEPGNAGRGEKSLPLLAHAFEWAREADPVQPLTAAPWVYEGFDRVNRCLIEESDVVSLHTYLSPDGTKALVDRFRREERPVIITEWMNRLTGSTLEALLPWFRSEKIGAYQWGLVKGRTQTNLSWATMNGGTPEPDPAVWQHDVMYPDGRPYDVDEMALVRRLSGKNLR